MKLYILGTAIKLEAVLSEAPDSMAITVVDEASRVRVNLAPMIEENTRTYYYILQTEEEWEPGVYTAIIEATAVSGGYVSVGRTQFQLGVRY